MPSPNLVNKLAAALLTPKHFTVAEDILGKHIASAKTANDDNRLQELFDLRGLMQKAKEEAGGTK